MKITKYVHSCILVETDDKVALFDPGDWSWQSGKLDLDQINRIDRLIITHEHSDHFYLPAVEAIAVKFPNIKIITTSELVPKLLHLNVESVQSESTNCTKIILANHESMMPVNPVDPPCQNISVDFLDKFTHPGDSHQIIRSKEVYCMPLAGPWGSMIGAVRKAVELRPKVVIPTHDWMWKPEWRDTMYERMELFFAKEGIRFIKAVDGVPFDV
jgi:L-ascorbate metabolism protein UlaG (beta-lactamase superfamily)